MGRLEILSIRITIEFDTVAIAYPIPNFEHRDQVVLSAISEILSSGKSSRLYSEIVDRRRLANVIYGYNLELKDDGYIPIYGYGKS